MTMYVKNLFKTKKTFLLLIIIFAVAGGAHVIAVEGSTKANRSKLSGGSTSSVNDKTLTDCVVHALENSYEVKLAKLDMFIAETDMMYTEAVYDIFFTTSASYLEDKRQNLSVFAADDNQQNACSVGLEKTFRSGTKIKGRLSDTRAWSNNPYVSKNPSHNAEIAFEVEQPVGKNFFGYNDRAKVSMTKLAIENASVKEQDIIEDIAVNVEKLFYKCIYANETLNVTKNMLNKAQELQDKNIKNFDLGLIEEVDLKASEANVARMKKDVLLSENNKKRALENLKLALNSSEDQIFYPEGTLPDSFDLADIGSYLKEAFDSRRDYKIAKKDIDIKGIDLKIKQNSLWPQIDLLATVKNNGLENEFDKAMGKVTSMDNTYYYAGVEVNVPLENSKARSERDRSLYEKEKSVIELKQLERKIITEVANAYNDVKTFSGSVSIISDAAKLEKEKLELEEARFNTGRSNTRRVIEYQQDLLRAELEKLALLLDHNLSVSALSKVLNLTLEKYKDKL
ncbi:MAG: TolC family protein [Candidatus Omnitrophica bacterium]|nr:TolC family protein [Candidatus Omnitrophota bacterium]